MLTKKSMKSMTKKILNKLFHLLSMLFGVRGIRYILKTDIFENIRVLLLRLSGAKIGKNTYIRSNLFITDPCNLTINSNSGISRNASLYLYDKLYIGSNVQIGSNLTVHTAEHKIQGIPSTPIIERGVTNSKVIIEDDVYIGSNVTILSGVIIGSKSVIGAGSVVTKSLPGGYLYAGSPAIEKKLIK